jgi:tetratricopeptide (TPR) repeat protein
MTGTRIVTIALMLLASGGAWAQGCGGLANHYGPFDYRTERNGKLQIVEHYHFAPEVEALIKGESSYIGDDLDYVLMTSPNHHRALLAAVRYGERTKTTQPPNMKYSIDCYFDRAIRFQPDDTVVREMYAEYLTKQGHTEDARKELQAADHYAADNAISHYNIGLLYFGLKDYDNALAQAQTSAQLGYQRPELKLMLQGVGKWKDPPATAASAPASGVSASAASAASSSP